MKGFYKVIAVAAATVLLGISSCHPLPDIDKRLCTVSKLSQIYIHDYNTGAVTVIDFEYAQYDEEMNISPVDTGEVNSHAPMIRRQTIEGDTLRSIEYTYRKDNLLDIHIESTTGSREMNFKLNSKKMADSLFNGSGYDFFSDVRYGSDGMRTQVKDSVLTVRNLDYVSATCDETERIRFEYPDSASIAAGNVVHNVIGIQQEDMTGMPYLWVTGAFGKQSKRFYTRKIVIREDGKIDEYVHDYTVDELKLLVEDRITVNGQNYKTVKYSYVEYTYKK